MMRTRNTPRSPLLTTTVVLALLAGADLRPAGASLVSSDNIYYGHLHNHSTLSGAVGTPEEAYSAARAAGLDFFGLADHGEQLTAAEYQQMKDAADAHQVDDVFTTFYGFEWSSSDYGHVAVINCAEYCSANSQPTFTALLEWLRVRSCVAFCNHPGRQDGAGTEFNHFTDSPSSSIVGMELWNKTVGFSTYYYDPTGYTSDSRERSGFFDDALFNGWRIGAAGSRDEHNGAWGGGSFRLAVLAGGNTRTALYNALKARNFYSTLDENLELSFTVNDHEMGASIMGGASHCVVRAADRDETETFSYVEVIHNGTVVCTEDVSGQTLPVVTCDLTTQKGDYLYCKVTESDGDEAISSPVFITSDGPDGPPRADLSAPLDNGPADLEPAQDVVKVNTTQPYFRIQLSDFDGIDDTSVTAATVSIAGLTSGVDYSFAHDSGADAITLAPLPGPVFGDGTYTITVSGIRDSINEIMPATVLTVQIDTSIVAPQTLHFQDGLNGYLGTVDTMICSGGGMADTSFGADTSLNVDTSDVYGGVSQVLLRFGSIIGEAAGRIPPGASISSATLRLRSLDTGNGGSLHAMLQPWSSGSTWNSLVNGVTADNVEARSAADDSIPSNSVADVDLDVTGTVQSWANGTMENNGWAVLPNGTDGWHIASCEYATADYRPELIVTFVSTGNLPPVAEAGPDQTVPDTDADGFATVTLNGSGSTDPDGYLASYSWTVDGQPVDDPDNNGIVTVTLALGSHTAQLEVTDNEGLSATDSVTIKVEVPSLFRDDFESGGFAAHTGASGALLKKTASMETTVSSGGAAAATFTYWARTSSLSSKYLYVEWSPNGSDWQLLNMLTGTTSWAPFSHDLPLTQASFRVRFRTDGSAGNNLAMVDDVLVTAAAGTPGNNPPVAIDDSAMTDEDTAVTIDVLANDSDPDGDTLTVTAATAPAHGVAAVNADDTVTYTPAANYSGTDSFTYTISDGRGGTATAAVYITIDPMNDNPVAVNDNATTPQDTAVTIAVLDNDSDVDGDALTVAIGTGPTQGAVTINADNTVTYTPAANYSGADSFTYTVSDGHGGTATATVSVTVTSSQPTPTVSVASIAMAVIPGKKYMATASVTLDSSLTGATVVGDWYFKGTLRASGVTATLSGNGGYEFTSFETPAKPGDEFKFVVIDVIHDTYRFAPDPAKDVATIVVGQ
jgi:hypothetical protein